MVEFGGFDMPLQYTSIREEHVAVRERAGIFDVCHMGEVLIGGTGALDAVQRLVANDASRLAPGGALYGVICNEQGGIVDDVIVTRGLDGAHYIVVTNAARHEVDITWMRENLAPHATLGDISDSSGLLAVQGPRAVAIVQRLTDTDITSLPPFGARGARLADIESRVSVVSRTGYTGEDGVELHIDADRAGELWDAVLEAGRDEGLLPCGLGARDTLRLEAGLRLYGQDMDDDTDPYSAGLGWTVKLGKGDFIGAEALRRIHAEGPPRRTVGLRLEGRAIARHGQEVRRDGVLAGEVTSGGFSFTLGTGIATALVDAALVDGTAAYEIDIRGTTAPAHPVSLPFYRRPTHATT
jgi:aminomethyltransferase